MLDALKVVFIFEMISAFIVIVSLYILKEKKKLLPCVFNKTAQSTELCILCINRKQIPICN